MSTPNTSAVYPYGRPIDKIVRYWLIAGLIMIFVQVMVGGITRLTGSGLSITKWEIVTGTLPPIGVDQWETEFDLYKLTPQYEKLNKGMSLADFKFIYFWEWFHRLWARMMGFVFLIPFIIFLIQKRIPRPLLIRMGVVVFLAILVASLGWIMVKSGFFQRPWVNAYKLTIHLSVALLLYGYLLWTTFGAFTHKTRVFHNPMLTKLGIAFTSLLAVQLFVGGIMSGMRAGLAFPTWPDMNGELVPGMLLEASQWSIDNLVNYEKNGFMPALIQFIHRNIAYLLTIIGLYYTYKCYRMVKNPLVKTGGLVLLLVLITQVLLGILTVINCKGTIPVTLGVLHQSVALLLLTVALFLNYNTRTTYK